MSDIKGLKIDWTNFSVLHEYSKSEMFFFKDVSLSDKSNSVMAEQYFVWANNDLLKNTDNLDAKTRIGIVANVKRAIDCKCETILKQFGYVKDINRINFPEIKEYFEHDGAPMISLVSYLTNLNMIIVEEIRKLRHGIEHEYSIPSVEAVKRAVSVAELFLIAINSKIKDMSYSITISSKKYDDEIQIYLTKESGRDLFLREPILMVNDKKFKATDKEYCELLHMLITGCFDGLPKLFNCNCEKQYIKYSQYFDEEEMFLEEDDVSF